MASKRKSEDEDRKLIGFIHCVTPCKKSKNNTTYFNAEMQTESEMFRLVGFTTKQQADMKRVEDTKSPISLKNVNVRPSRVENSMDIVMNKSSEFSVVNNVKFQRRQLKFHDDSQLVDKTLEDVICPSQGVSLFFIDIDLLPFSSD